MPFDLPPDESAAPDGGLLDACSHAVSSAVARHGLTLTLVAAPVESSSRGG